jgi:predicted O-methyltransferase YrrM
MRIPGIKLYRKIRYRKGFGVHSPFVYNLITKIIEDKSAYYVFDDIEKFRNRLLSEKNETGRITLEETQSRNYGAILFRLAHFFRCQTIVEIGSSTGIMGLYLATASRAQSRCYLLEERENVLQTLHQWALAHDLQHIYCITGQYKETIQSLSLRMQKADLIFINQPSDSMDVEAVISLCRPLIGKQSILILNDIVRNKEVKTVWQTLKEHPQSRVMLDLYELGIVFFDDKLPKRYYKSYFKHEKKQNLYKNRRRGIHFLGWRKKSTKNTSSHRGLRNY